jgi:ornithine carbamoyltransferase
MNDKVNKAKKLKDFKKFQVTSKVMSCAKKDAIFLHCLPRGSEVSNDVFLGNQSRVWQQALNRIYVQKSILLYCFEKLR